MIERLKADFPEFKFREGKEFRWRPRTRTVTLGRISAGDNPGSGVEGGVDAKYALLALHEVAHALLGHEDDTYDLKRLKCEVEAWEKVRAELAPRYDIEFDEELMQDMLDTYREWLHKKSACPICKQCRLQTKSGGYVCVNCD
ncbi:hypothetical protein FWC63_02610 [Candidatus Saccharibacteria bacterium]|nr:hypothetical protein [Candidatus Saccharibacteria bacterium]